MVFAVSYGGTNAAASQAIIAFAVLDIFSKPLWAGFLLFGSESVARYGSWTGFSNTGLEIDFVIPRSLYPSSGSRYATETGTRLVTPHIGQPRDVVFASLHPATGSGSTKRDQTLPCSAFLNKRATTSQASCSTPDLRNEAACWN